MGFKEGAEPDIPEDRSDVGGRALLVRAYGEIEPGGKPVIYNLAAKELDERRLVVTWQLSQKAVSVFGPAYLWVISDAEWPF